MNTVASSRLPRGHGASGLRPWVILMGLLPSLAWSAQDGAASTAGWSSLLQGLLGLVIVLALLYGFLLFLRRFGAMSGHGSPMVKVVGGVMLSPRERLVMVEIQNTWLVLGVASGQVSLLHTLPRPEGVDDAPNAAAPAFAGRLADMLRKSRRD